MTLMELFVFVVVIAVAVGVILAMVMRWKALLLVLLLSAIGIAVIAWWPVDESAGPPIFPPLLVATGIGMLSTVAGFGGVALGVVFRGALTRRSDPKA